jgi:hypothetical protein
MQPSDSLVTKSEDVLDAQRALRSLDVPADQLFHWILAGLVIHPEGTDIMRSESGWKGHR